MLSMIVGGVGELFADIFAEDEATRRAMKAAAWGVAGAVGVADALMPLSGAASASVVLAVAIDSAGPAAVMMATQGVVAAADDQKAKSAIDAVGSIVAGGMTSSMALAKTAGGAAMGAAAGAAVDGDDGAIAGLGMGASVMRGSWVENGAKLAGGLAGAGIGAAATDDGGGAQLGFSVGTSIGGAGAGLAATDAMAAENAALAGGSDADVAAAGAAGMQRSAVITLAGEAAAPLVAVAARGDERGFLEVYSTLRSAAAATARGVGAAEAVGEGLAAEQAVLLEGSIVSSVTGIAQGVGEVAVRVREKDERRRDMRGEEKARADHRRRAIGLVSDVSAEIVSRRGGERA